jgi:hypothetical protein
MVDRAMDSMTKAKTALAAKRRKNFEEQAAPEKNAQPILFLLCGI